MVRYGQSQMRILVACERSQRLTMELRRLGHEAFSCDTAPAMRKDHLDWHIQGDCIEQLGNGQQWGMIVAFPPCTHLSAAGAQYWPQKQAEQAAAIEFVKAIANANCPRIAIENPVGVLSTAMRKPDQIIQPWQFGEAFTKRTCLWLKGLPLLTPTNVVEPTAFWCSSSYRGGKRKDGTRRKNPLKNANPYGGKGPDRKRCLTFAGIAKAMAEQWAGDV